MPPKRGRDDDGGGEESAKRSRGGGGGGRTVSGERDARHVAADAEETSRVELEAVKAQLSASKMETYGLKTALLSVRGELAETSRAASAFRDTLTTKSEQLEEVSDDLVKANAKVVELIQAEGARRAEGRGNIEELLNDDAGRPELCRRLGSRACAAVL